MQERIALPKWFWNLFEQYLDGVSRAQIILEEIENSGMFKGAEVSLYPLLIKNQ